MLLVTYIEVMTDILKESPILSDFAKWLVTELTYIYITRQKI